MKAPQPVPVIPAETPRHECCGQSHDVCLFQAGSLYCITHNCANPHHRRTR